MNSPNEESTERGDAPAALPVPSGGPPSLPDDAAMRDWAEHLVERARVEGVELTGEGGLLTGLVRQVLQTGLEVELSDHLGYEAHDPAGRGSGNSRNGAYPKTVRTDVGEVTLDMPRDRAGTFEPVRVECLDDHRMHAERYSVPPAAAESIENTRARGGRVVAVGTTVVRSLEAWARAGAPRDGAFRRTDLFLRPGRTFHQVDAMVTNFHLPRSTLLVLLAAFAGREWILERYRDAVREGYRFYSYGDAMLLL